MGADFVIVDVVIGSARSGAVLIPHGRVPQHFGPLQGHRVRRLHLQTGLQAAADAGAALGHGRQQKAVQGGHGVGGRRCVFVVVVRLVPWRQTQKGDGFAKKVRFEPSVLGELVDAVAVERRGGGGWFFVVLWMGAAGSLR